MGCPLKSSGKKRDIFVYSLAVLSLLTFFLVKRIGHQPPVVRGEMVEAARLMDRVIRQVSRCREGRGMAIDRGADPNGTGLIGLSFSPLTTSLGNLEAKRTTTNPNFAGLLVRLFWEAGVRRGDAVAIGASSSFPALILASLCAAEAMGLEPLLISSLGASQWGANDPEFHWLDIQDCLESAGLLPIEPLAFSLGGEGDSGLDMSLEGRAFLVEEVRKRGFPLLQESTLADIVNERLQLYESAARERGKQMRAFVNIGGSYANLGTDSRVLRLRAGLVEAQDFPPPGRRGVLFEMVARGVPVIHLLHIKGLTERYGLPWDPRPLPEPGEGEIYRAKSLVRRSFFLIGTIYLVLTGVLFFLFRKNGD